MSIKKWGICRSLHREQLINGDFNAWLSIEEKMRDHSLVPPLIRRAKTDTPSPDFEEESSQDLESFSMGKSKIRTKST